MPEFDFDDYDFTWENYDFDWEKGEFTLEGAITPTGTADRWLQWRRSAAGDI